MDKLCTLSLLFLYLNGIVNNIFFHFDRAAPLSPVQFEGMQYHTGNGYNEAEMANYNRTLTLKKPPIGYNFDTMGQKPTMYKMNPGADPKEYDIYQNRSLPRPPKEEHTEEFINNTNHLEIDQSKPVDSLLMAEDA